MSEAEQKETEFISGAIEGIIQKAADKWQVAVKPDGSQYAKNLWTKDAELVAALSQKIGQSGGFVCNVSHWTNNEGKPIRSLWIDSEGVAPQNEIVRVEGGGSKMGVTSEPAQWTQTKPDVDWDAKERRDYRSRAWAQTLGAFTHTIKVDESPEDVFARLQPFQRKVYEDVTGRFAYPEDGSDAPF